MNPPLPQRNPSNETEMSWSASLALVDDLLAALRAWQPRDSPPSPATEQDVAVLSALSCIPWAQTRQAPFEDSGFGDSTR